MEENRERLKLSELADAILKQAGCTIFGLPKREVEYAQVKFEAGMQTGAYSRNSERKRD